MGPPGRSAQPVKKPAGKGPEGSDAVAASPDRSRCRRAAALPVSKSQIHLGSPGRKASAAVWPSRLAAARGPRRSGLGPGLVRTRCQAGRAAVLGLRFGSTAGTPAVDPVCSSACPGAVTSPAVLPVTTRSQPRRAAVTVPGLSAQTRTVTRDAAAAAAASASVGPARPGRRPAAYPAATCDSNERRPARGSSWTNSLPPGPVTPAPGTVRGRTAAAAGLSVPGLGF